MATIQHIKYIYQVCFIMFLKCIFVCLQEEEVDYETTTYEVEMTTTRTTEYSIEGSSKGPTTQVTKKSSTTGGPGGTQTTVTDA